MLGLKSPTPAAWTATALAHLDAILNDHAHCELKAAANALSLTADYPEHPGLAPAMAALCREEMAHFEQVHAHMRVRGVPLGRRPRNRYAQALRKLVRPGAATLMDRLLIAGIIEARSTERLLLLAKHLPQTPDHALAAFYHELGAVEAGHYRTFVSLAEAHYPPAEVRARLDKLLTAEAEILAGFPIDPVMH